MCVAVMKLALKIALAIALMPFRIFSATVLQASNKVLYLSMGYNQTDAIPAQHALSSKEMPRGPVPFPAQGGGGYGIHGGRLITEMTGSRGGVVTTGSGSAFLNAGYLVKSGSYFRVYPLVGIGGSNVGTVVSDYPDSANRDGGSFRRLEVAGSSGPLVNLGVGLEFKLGSRFGVMAGIRFGFVFSPLTTGRLTVLTPFAHFIGGVGTFRKYSKHPSK